ncbi:N-methylproline demethylase [Roseovarius spongiae]|uniref:N-methylproline demethylase n=1 Tax=Roseovarius spongiae TaxID=2320272 RepID=A0A3A8ASP6_9RHOB|nr:NADH:flavin oxidoreductase [Roseovarius spongiae]RKF14167.1 N-methylproline demethylase [Roseovarius spongiae]
MNDTAPSTPKDPLLQPLKIGNLTIRNRIMSTSHACGLQVDGYPQETYQAYHEEKAKGGIGLSMFGGSSNIAPDSPNIFSQINVGEDGVIPHLQRFSERMHAQGAALMCQITHLGRRGDPYQGDWLPAIGPSPLRETLHRAIPREMDRHDIDRVIAAYAAAARRCEEGGLDGIETLTGGHILGQFLSPRTNQRSDEFGGSLENRMRLTLMVHDAMREAVGADFLIGIRWVVDEGPDGMLSPEESARAAQMLQAAGGADFFNAIYGSMDTMRALTMENMPGMGTPIAPWVEHVGRFRREVGLPVFHAARISDLASARHAVAEGHIDMAGMTRAQIADPHLVAKLAAGEEDRVRPCVGAQHCQSQYRPKCLHNAVTGRETILPHDVRPADSPRRAVVVGAGPGGLEAARVLALRGHEVSVHEAAGQAGGQLVLASSGWRRDITGIIDWRLAELERANVPIHYNAFMEAADVAALNPDLVILATGGLPQTGFGPGADLALSAWDVIGGQAKPAPRVLVWDGTGRHPAPMAAKLAQEAGSEVVFATIDAGVAQDLTYAETTRWRTEFSRAGLAPLTDLRLVSVARAANRLTATLLNELTREEMRIDVDQVVVDMGTVPDNEMFDALRIDAANDGVTDIGALIDRRPQPRGRAGYELHRIGDAQASRNVHAAIYDAFRLCHIA